MFFFWKCQRMSATKRIVIVDGPLGLKKTFCIFFSWCCVHVLSDRHTNIKQSTKSVSDIAEKSLGMCTVVNLCTLPLDSNLNGPFMEVAGIEDKMLLLSLSANQEQNILTICQNLLLALVRKLLLKDRRCYIYF